MVKVEKLKKYSVTYTSERWVSYYVEAKSPDEAEKIASERYIEGEPDDEGEDMVGVGVDAL